MNAWLPQASYPCGNFSDTSSVKFQHQKTKGSVGHAFTVCIHTENPNQMSFYPSVLQEISVLFELILGHLCYRLTDVPPQPNSPPDNVMVERRPRPGERGGLKSRILPRKRQTRFETIKSNNIRSSGISPALALPLILHLPSHLTMSD
jgi:hypothetical protein